MNLSIRQILKRRAFRKAKKKGELLSKDFNRAELEALIAYLKKFYIETLEWEVSKTRRYSPFKTNAWNIVEVIEMIELIISDDTDYQPHDWAFLKLNRAGETSNKSHCRAFAAGSVASELINTPANAGTEGRNGT